MTLRIAVLVKQVPRFDHFELGADGRLRRDEVELEMNPYCRRAVTQGVALAGETGGTCTVFTLGPPSAEDTLREAVAGGADRGVLISDPAFAGSDTLATAKALVAALQARGPFELILLGRNSVDADTGQVGPELAELLGLPFVCSVRELEVNGRGLRAVCEQDDGHIEVRAPLPAIVSCAERLCDPTKMDPERRAAVADERLEKLDATALGSGPWGVAASPTSVGEVSMLSATRQRRVLDGSLEEQVGEVARVLGDLDLLRGFSAEDEELEVPARRRTATGVDVAVIVEPGETRSTRELVGRGVVLAEQLGGREVAALVTTPVDSSTVASWGVDRLVHADHVAVAEDVAHTFTPWLLENQPSVVLVPATLWGREVASRIAARLDVGLTGDAVALDVDDGRLIAWKPAFGGQLVAAIRSRSDIQMATVRPGVLPLPRPAQGRALARVERVVPVTRSLLRHGHRTVDDELAVLNAARVVIGVGAGVPDTEYHLLDGLRDVLQAEVGATRKVTDKGWLPRSRQIGITGQSIRPLLYIAVGIQGKFNHMVGVRAAHCVVAINHDRDALVFDESDLGIVADWHAAVPLLAHALSESVTAH